MTNREILKGYIKNIFLQMEEAGVTSNFGSITKTGTIPGSEEYNTPKAFKKKKKKNKDKYLDPAVVSESIDERD
jgi:hypothetical protein